MADIFDEVEADLRAERARNLAVRYGGLLAALALLVVAAAAAWQVWQWYEARQDRAVAALYLDAMQAASPGAGKTADPQAALAGFTHVAAEGPRGYRTLARLQAAALKADAGDAAGAAALWDAVANDGEADRLFRDLASYLAVQHRLDEGDPEALAARLRPLLAPDSPWHALAEEAQATLELRRGDTVKAREELKRLAQDTTAPQGVRERAGAVLGRIGG